MDPTETWPQGAGAVPTPGPTPTARDATEDAFENALLGRTLGGYTLTSVLGRGGMGVVFAGVQTSLQRDVAVKVLPPAFNADLPRVRRFHREAQAMTRVSHPNVVTIFDFGETDGVLWIAMERLRGRTLGALIEQGPMPPARAVAIGVQIAEALGAAHDVGVIHRDVKPENVVLLDTDRDFVKVLDFGLAWSPDPDTRSTVGSITGTPAYMSPEQALGSELTPASDVYSLAVMLYELLSGKRPFEGPTPLVLAAHIREAPPDLAAIAPGLPRPLCQLIMSALAKAPGARPANAHAFAAALTAASLRPPARPRRWGWAALALVAALGIGAWLVVNGRTTANTLTPAPAVTPVVSQTSPPPAPSSATTADMTLALPAFSGLDALRGTLKQLGVARLADAFAVRTDTVASRLVGWQTHRYDLPTGLFEKTLSVPVAGARKSIELRVQLIGDRVARIVIDLFERDPSLEWDMAKALGRPGERVADADECPAYRWSGHGLVTLVRVFQPLGDDGVAPAAISWHSLVFAPAEHFDADTAAFAMQQDVDAAVESAQVAVENGEPTLSTAIDDLGKLLETSPSAGAARLLRCQALHDAGRSEEASSECRLAEQSVDDVVRAQAGYRLALITASTGDVSHAITELGALRTRLADAATPDEARELVGPIELHLAALRGDRTEHVIQALLCERTDLVDRDVARATSVPREYGLADVGDVTTRVDALELDKEDCP